MKLAHSIRNGMTIGKLVLFFALVIIVSGSNCNPPPDPPPQFEINITGVTTAPLNESYRINWEYSPAARAEDQFIEMQSLTISSHLRFFLGCPPAEFRPPGLPEPTDCGNEIETSACPDDGSLFTNNCRTLSRQFTGPVIVSVTAKDSLTGNWKRKSVILKLPNSHFRATVSELSNQGFPRLGDAVGKPLEFMKYFAVYNNDRSNVEIEGLSVPPFNQAFIAGRPFFASSTNVEEAQAFGITLGRNFDILRPGFIQSTQGAQYLNRRTHADAIVYAATLQLSGTAETITDPRSGETVTIIGQLPVTVTANGASTISFPQTRILIQIDLAGSLAQIVPALEPMVPGNVKLGNPVQGLVMPTFGGEINPVVTPTISAESQITLLRANQNSPTGITNGNIPDAGVAFSITRTNGELLLPAAAALNDINWSGVPAYPDNNLGPLLTGN